MKQIVYKIAETRDEIEQAYQLVHEEYTKRGYYPPSPHHIKVSLYNALPQTTTFIAKYHGKVIGTITVIPDSPIGIPMETIYPDEINCLRVNKREIAEVSMLAINTQLFGKSVFVMLHSKKLFFVFRLFKLVFDYVRFQEKLTDICIIHHPKHNLLYKFLAFQEIGDERSYPGANEKPAVAKKLDLITIAHEIKEHHRTGLERMFFRGNSDSNSLTKKLKFDNALLSYFFIKKSDVFATMSFHELQYLKKCYPLFNFDNLLKKTPIDNKRATHNR